MCFCIVFNSLRDDQLVTGVVPAPVVNGCEQKHHLLGELCLQPWQKATHQKSALDSQSGNFKFLSFISHLCCVFKGWVMQGFEEHFIGMIFALISSPFYYFNSTRFN